MMKLEDLLKKLKEHQPLILNFGKGYDCEHDILEKLEWNEDRNSYVGEMGILWDTKLLIEIAQGKVENTRLEE